MLRVMVAVGVFMVIFIYLTLTNPGEVKVVLYKGLQFHVPMAVLLVVNVAVGFVLAYLLGIMKDIKIAVLERRLAGQSRVKDKLVEAVDVEDAFSPEASLRYLEAVKTGKDPHLLSLYARFLRGVGRLSEAKELHSELSLKNKRGPILADFLRDLVRDGRFTEVVSMVKDLPRNAVTPSIAQVAVEAATAAGDVDFAVAMAEKLYKDVPSPATESLLLGVKVEQMRTKGDVGGLKKVLKKHPDFVPALSALVDMGEGKVVLDALKNAYKKTGDLTFLFWLVDVVVKREGADPRRVVDFMNRISSKDERGVNLVKAYMYAELGMYQEALKVLEEAGDAGRAIQDYVRFVAVRGMGRLEESCQYAETISRRGAFVYRCGVCGAFYFRLEPVCARCKNYSTVRLEVEGGV